MNDVAAELEKWLREEAAKRTKAARARREYASVATGATGSERKAAHALAQSMAGRKLPKTSRAEDEKSAVIQDRIAVNLDKEAAMIATFADFVAGNR